MWKMLYLLVLDTGVPSKNDEQSDEYLSAAALKLIGGSKKGTTSTASFLLPFLSIYLMLCSKS